MIYEMRLYSIAAGRMPDNLRRFEEFLPALFARHGVNNVGRWVVTSGSDGPQFLYLMAHESLEQRERRWASFYNDDDWWRVRAETNGASQIVERYELNFLRPSSAWLPDVDGGVLAGVHHLQFLDVLAGAQADATARLKDIVAPCVSDQGGRVMMIGDFLTGVRLPRVALMTAWRDAAHLHEASLAMDNDPRHRDAVEAERGRFGAALLAHAVSYVLQPTGFHLPTANLGYRI